MKPMLRHEGDSMETRQQDSARRLAALQAAATRRANDEAGHVREEALLLQASYMTNMEASGGAALPVGGGRSMIDVQGYRRNFYRLGFTNLCKMARLQAERNWFMRPVTERNIAIHGHGFRFNTPEAREWAVDAKTKLWRYNFQRIHDDGIREWFTTTNVVALWRRASKPGTMPYVEILPAERCDYKVINGVEFLTVCYRAKRNAKIDKKLEARLGKKLWQAIKTGGKLEIADDDDEWDFEVMTGAGSSDGLAMPAMTAVQDDLEFVEAVKAGDWNGAWRRRITILHVKKGYGVQSGTNAGTVRTHAKRKQLEAINKWLRELQGHGNAATNFDQDFGYVVFPADFFAEEITAPAYARMMLYGGIPAVQLLKSESQISGVSPYLMMLLRAEAFAFRSRYAWFLSRIFQSESFRGQLLDDPPPLVPEWSDKLLYTIKERQEQAEMLRGSGASRRTQREAAGLDHDRESQRNKEEIADPDSVVPVFETNQGLPAARYQKIYPGTPGKSQAAAGSPGRPTDQK
jgi:hypothetical protein